MIWLMFYLFFLAVAAGFGALAAWSDIKGMTIPNLHSAVILGAFPLAYMAAWLAGADVFYAPLSHVISFGIVFVISAAFFYFRIMGAADSKLASAYALWMGLPGLAPFLFYMTLMGAVLGIATLVLKRRKPLTAPPAGSWMDQAQKGADKVPYGVAIVFGAFVSFVVLGYVGSEALASFVQS